MDTIKVKEEILDAAADLMAVSGASTFVATTIHKPMISTESIVLDSTRKRKSWKHTQINEIEMKETIDEINEMPKFIKSCRKKKSILNHKETLTPEREERLRKSLEMKTVPLINTKTPHVGRFGQAKAAFTLKHPEFNVSSLNERDFIKLCNEMCFVELQKYTMVRMLATDHHYVRNLLGAHMRSLGLNPRVMTFNKNDIYSYSMNPNIRFDLSPHLVFHKRRE